MTDRRYAWLVVALASFACMIAVGVTFGAFGLFVHPVAAAFKLSRADINSALILVNLGNALLAPLIGRLIDRASVRLVFFGSALCFGAGFLCLGLSNSVMLDAAVLLILIPIGFLGVGDLTLSILVARWFVADRGRAMALASLGMNLGTVLVSPAVGLLIHALGWRQALLIMGAAIAALLAPLSLALRAPASRATSQLSLDPSQTEGPQSLFVILSTGAFWVLALAGGVAFAVAQTLTISLTPMGEDQGLSALQATSLMPVLGAGSIAGGLLLSIVADRLERVALFGGLLLIGAALSAALKWLHGYEFMLTAAGVLGLATGALAPTFFTLLADRFGAASYGAVRGLALPVTSLLGMIAVRLAGELYDRTGGYDALFDIFIGAQALAAAAIFICRAGQREPGGSPRLRPRDRPAG